MGYAITTLRGKNKAKEMKTGEKWVNDVDGSTWEKKADGSVSVTHNGNTYDNAYSSPSGNSQYTGSSVGIKTNNSLQQAYKDEMNANSKAWWNADDEEKARLHARNQELAALLKGDVAYDKGTGTWSGTAGGITEEDILDWEHDEEKPEYDSQYDSKIEDMLNEILTRDKFSYDVANDPLYQQYAEMYRREGDRASRETLAEAAAGAGGMNTYAMTAAQQANAYYNSKLNDAIPELYQAAYEKYLKDIDLKVQDLGLLQAMDDKQYGRYRDTMNDWYNDKNFAYGNFQDAVAQGNWQTNFDNNNYWANKEFDYNDMWANKEWDYNDAWKNKEWDANRSDIDYERNQTETETAKADIEWLIKSGVSANNIDPALIKKAGLTQAQVNEMVSYYNQQNAPKSTSSSSKGYSYTPKTNDKVETKDDVTDEEDYSYNPSDKPQSKPTTDAGQVAKGLTDLGLGLIYSPEIIVELANAGAIYEDDGVLKWSMGWNANNFEEKLRNQPFPGLISPLNW